MMCQHTSFLYPKCLSSDLAAAAGAGWQALPWLAVVDTYRALSVESITRTATVGSPVISRTT